jgi:hypothetical protein
MYIYHITLLHILEDSNLYGFVVWQMETLCEDKYFGSRCGISYADIIIFHGALKMGMTASLHKALYSESFTV